jgi:hypothetical protein
LGLTVRDAFIDRNWYSNLKVKQVVMTGNRKSNGTMFLNPEAELVCEREQIVNMGTTG